MFDIGFSELMLIGVVALLVLGPERLPGFARTLGGFVGKARASWNAMRAEIERELAAEELKRTLRETEASIRRDAESIQSVTAAAVAPVAALGTELMLDLSPEERARAAERAPADVAGEAATPAGDATLASDATPVDDAARPRDLRASAAAAAADTVASAPDATGRTPS